MTTEHKENKDSIIKIALNLAVTCIVSGIIISVVYFLTADIAVKAQEDLQKAALQSLVEEADQYTPIPGKTGFYTATRNGEIVAYVIPAESKGYGGAMKLLVAVSPDNKVMKYTITQSKETPGLGDKAAKEPFTEQFIGKTSENLEVTKDANNKDNIQAISGATITSRAVTLAVKTAVDEASILTKGGN